MTREPLPPAPRRRSRICALVAAIVYLALVLWALSDLAIGPSAYLLGPPGATRRAVLTRADQSMVIGVVTRNARVLSQRPWDLRGVGQCYPLPRAYVLGEHMFGSGLLAAVPLALTGDPILSYNALVALTLWIPALAMYALAFHFTRDPAGSFVAGLLFAFSRWRLMDPAHPYVHGDLWVPLGLLFLHRTFVQPRWTNALALAAFTVLSLGESLYPLIAGAVLGATYTIALVARHRRRLGKPLVRLGAVAALVGAAGLFVFLPYLETVRQWPVLGGRDSLFWMPGMYLPGGAAFPGWVLTALAAVALADRVARPRTCVHGEDPRLPIALGGILVWWCSIWMLPLPGIAALPSPLAVARDLVPGLGAVRALSNVGIGVTLSLAFLAAYSVRVLGRERPPLRWTLAAATSCAILLEQFAPAIAARSFGTPFDLTPYRAALDSEDVALLARADAGAVLDLPMTGQRQFLGNAHPLLVGAYHGRPTGACYNSFGTAVTDQVAELARRVPQPAALDALAALGFGTLVVHKERLLSKHGRWLLPKLEAVAQNDARLEEVGRSRDHVLYRLRPIGAAEQFRVLASARIHPPHAVAGPEAAIPFVFRNEGRLVFRHPDPIVPSEVVLRWHRSEADAPAESRSRALLPLALTGGDQATVVVEASVPVPPGRYLVELVRASDPGFVLTRRIVEVRAAASAGPPPPPKDAAGA